VAPPDQLAAVVQLLSPPPPTQVYVLGICRTSSCSTCGIQLVTFGFCDLGRGRFVNLRTGVSSRRKAP
jgi:hypothetical protein